MLGDPREPIEVNLLQTLRGISTDTGYDVPEPFRLVTRDVLDISQLIGYENQLPALLLMLLDSERTSILGHRIDVMLAGQVSLFFPPGPFLPAAEANRYRSSVERALMVDRRRGGYADDTFLTGSPPAGLWEGTSLLAVVIPFSVMYEYHVNLPAQQVA